MDSRLETDSILSHYRIVSRIGAGGMGDVCLAQDLRLDRKVVLKILPSEFAEDTDRMTRFVREARSASALNHPNIITIYEIGEADGIHFIATEFIEGETLKEYASNKALNFRSVVEIAIQVASALDEAHRAGIVHRDIKPENIMVRPNGLVKVLDFGVAKLTEVADPGSLQKPGDEAATAIRSGTNPGMIIGTANYMSPEQARGKDVDARTDIFSFGVVFYEMIAGRKPFTGGTPVEIIAAILHMVPEPLSGDVPKEIANIIRKCLKKDRNKRYETIKAVLDDLSDVKQHLDLEQTLERGAEKDRTEPKTQLFRKTTFDEFVEPTPDHADSGPSRKYLAIGGAILLILSLGFGYWLFNRSAGQTAKQVGSIAVMPFVNESGNPENDYLSDGMTETLINSLSQVPNLSVKARSSVFRYKAKELDLKKVAAELGVHAILTGRVAQRADQLTLNVELIDAQTETTIWGNRYDRKASDLVTLQSDVARDVSGKLKSKLSGADEARVTKSFTTDHEAYQLYLQGLYRWNRRTPEDLRKSISFFQQAAEKDPAYAQAYAWLALAYSVLNANTRMSRQELVTNRLEERAALKRAQELDDSLAEIHVVLAGIKKDVEWDFAAAENEYKRAIELNPNFATARQWYSEFLSTLGRRDEAWIEVNKAHDIDPFSRAINANIGLRLVEARRFSEAIAQYKTVIEMEPNYPVVHSLLSRAYEANGHYTEAIAENRIADILLEKETTKGAETKAAAFLYAFNAGGAQGYWRKHLEIGLEEFQKGYETAFSIAVIYSRLGDKERTFEWLEKSYAFHEERLNYLKAEPAFDEFASDPQFKEILKRMGLPE
jgi:serine/threonine-protein kinase